MTFLPTNINSISSESNVFAVFQNHFCEALHINHDLNSGLLSIIAIHNTRMGPALGGCRFIPYTSFDAAVVDAIRLAKGMSYKSAVANLPFGGGKAVIIRTPEIKDRMQLLAAFGKFVHSLGGRYITAEDSGTNVADMDVIRTLTPFVTGHTAQSFAIKDPSLLTALGVRCGIQAAVQKKYGLTSLAGLHVAIQGVGNVGYALIKELLPLGVKITVSDINTDALARCATLGVNTTSIDNIHKIPCDIFSPCALSNAINENNHHEIQAAIIAGSANNQLENRGLALKLKERDILYAPDYVINAGGLIHVTAQYLNHNEATAKQKVMEIYHTLMMIFNESDKQNTTTVAISDRIAEQRIYAGSA